MRMIECPKCHSGVFNYVQYEDGRYVIRSPCGWELVELQPCLDDLDVITPDD